MKIGILQTGTAPQNLAQAQGDYDDRMRWLLGENENSYVTYKVEDGELPKSPDEADGWIITGSRHGAYEDHPWIAPLEDFIRALAKAQKPLVGICFGHQIIAQAMGGRVEKSSTGWIVGPQEYKLQDGQTFTANAWHQDQVLEAPQGANIVAEGQGCSIAALHYPGFCLTVQPHPEFSGEYFRGLLAEKGHILPEALHQSALGRSQAQVGYDPFARDALRAFLQSGGQLPSRQGSGKSDVDLPVSQ
jgi:GMP synthase-like glutamine amidotransferase